MELIDEQRAMYVAAGLPYPIQKRDSMGGRSPRDTIERLSYDAKVGVIVHEVLATIADDARAMSLEDRVRVVEETVVPLTSRRRDLGRGDKTAMRVTGLVSQYLALFLPPSEAEFLGAELKAGSGRTDLAWWLPGVGAWFDELKTGRGFSVFYDDDTMRQVYRYLDHGIAAYGSGFRGVRVIPLGNLHAARLVTPSGATVPLDDLISLTSRSPRSVA